MKIWIISDPHFGHDKLAEENLRPAGFDEKLIANIGLHVNHDDILICLGDICWKDDALWHERLRYIPCKRWLCIGNHDKKSFTYYMEHGWDWVGGSFKLEIFGKKLLFSHFPMKDNGDLDFDINFHGHFHAFGLDRVREMEPELFALLTPKHRLISMEALKYEPIKLQRLVEEFNIQKYQDLFGVTDGIQ
jgi:calcineurin-like phosphoesterase family protein